MARCLFFTVTVCALFAATGCVSLLNEEDGDVEPQQGEFRVSVTPGIVYLTTNSPTATVNLSVVCGGAYPPAECANLTDVGWDSPEEDAQGIYAVTTAISDHQANNTTAQIKWTVGARNFYGSPLAVGNHDLVSFRPTKVPKGLTLTGRCYVDVQLDVPGAGPTREEEPAAKPSLIACPQTVIIRPTDSGPITAHCAITYKGTNTLLVAINKSGPDAAKFAYAAPSTPFQMGRRATFFVAVTFFGTTDVGTHYYAQLRLIADNGASENIYLDAYR